LCASQAVSLDAPLDEEGKTLGGNKTRRISMMHRFEGVNEGDSIYFIKAGQPHFEK
jgi:hypothetical protein